MPDKAILCYLRSKNHGPSHVFSLVGGLASGSSEGSVRLVNIVLPLLKAILFSALKSLCVEVNAHYLSEVLDRAARTWQMTEFKLAFGRETLDEQLGVAQIHMAPGLALSSSS